MKNTIYFFKNFDSFDFGWLILSLGMAIGAGIVMVPVKAGAAGFWAFTTSILIAYPGMYLFQKLYMQTLLSSKEPVTYSELIKKLLGKQWGGFLTILYLLMQLIWVMVYAVVVKNTLAKYLYEWGLTTNPNLSSNMTFSFILMVIILFIGLKSSSLLIKVATPILIILVGSIIFTTFTLIPSWEFGGLSTDYTTREFILQVILLLPFSLTTILFIQSLNPMIISYRKRYGSDYEIAAVKSIGVMTLAFIILLLVIGSYIFSFAFVIPHEVALQGVANNYTAFMLFSNENGSTVTISILAVTSLLISLCAVLSPFLSILSGVSEGVKGMLLHILSYLKINISEEKMAKIVPVVIFFIIWFSVVLKAPVYTLAAYCGPIFGIIGCIIPFILVHKVEELMKYQNFSAYIVLFVGIVLIISPFISLLQ